MQGHDIIIIGVSVGGVEALSNLVAQFPEDLAAAIFIVQHISPTATSQLAQILDRTGPLPAAMAQDCESFELGHIYVAPPDHHLLVKQDRLRVTRGLWRENRVRPAIDPLFRSVAVTYGACVAGIALTGLKNDGTSGLLAIKRCSGIAMVQGPTDALYPDMPLSALEQVEVDYCVPLVKMGAILYRLIQEPAAGMTSIPEDLRIEVSIAENPTDYSDCIEELGESSQ